MRIYQLGSESYSANLRAAFSGLEAVTLRELIAGRAEASADARYLLSLETGRAVSYQGLKGQARALVARLQGLGLSAGDKVAFLLDNGLFTAELFLGVMYGGIVAVPLNVRAAVSQLAYKVEQCDAKVVFVASEYAALMSEVLTLVRRPVRVVAADGVGVTWRSVSRFGGIQRFGETGAGGRCAFDAHVGEPGTSQGGGAHA